MATIYYFAYDHEKPRGGQKSAYRHVDILRAQGLDAFVLHTAPGCRLTWFDNETPVVDAASLRARFDPVHDVVALPEDLGVRIGSFPGRKVILNQNVYYGFYAFGFRQPPEYPYLRGDVIGAIVKSEHNRDYLRFAFPNLAVHRVVNGIDATRFVYRDPCGRRPAFAYVPTKAEVDTAQVIHLLEARARQGINQLAGIEWVPLRSLSESGVAETLAQCQLLLFPSLHEGMGRLPLEAMLSGTIVAAYASGPLTEYLSAEHGVVATPGDVPALVRGIEHVAALRAGDEPGLRRMAERARDVACWHSMARERETVLAAWDALLAART